MSLGLSGLKALSQRHSWWTFQPQKKYLAPPPQKKNSPIHRRQPPGPSAPPPPGTPPPPPGIISKNRSPLLAPQTPPSPFPNRKKIKFSETSTKHCLGGLCLFGAWDARKNVHDHHQKRIFWGTFLASKKNFPGRWCPIKARNIYHQNLSSVTPLFCGQRKVPHWNRVVYAFFFLAWDAGAQGPLRTCHRNC